jgi:hypothetical protein
VSDDVTGVVLQDVAEALPDLRMLDIAFQQEYHLQALGGLLVLGRLEELTRLGVRNMSDVAHRPNDITGRQWKVFVSGRPGVGKDRLTTNN